MDQLRAYYYLTKPGIIFSNVFAATAGFLLASGWHASVELMLWLIGGMTLIIASACVYNNYIDRGIDAHMQRTKKRALVSGKISVGRALTFATLLLVGGLFCLAHTNVLTLILGIIAFVTYVFIYGYVKRHSVHGTLVGTLPGALPPVAGYTAVVGSIDATAAMLYLILTVWQMAHFYAIAIFRRDDYAAAKIPVYSVVYGTRMTRQWIFVYICLLAVIAPLLAFVSSEGWIYMLVSFVVTITWLIQAIRFRQLDDVKWARKMFGYSLIVLIVLCVSIGVGVVIP